MSDRIVVIITVVCLAVAAIADWWAGHTWSLDVLYVVPVALVCMVRHQRRAWCGAVVVTALIALVLGALVQPSPVPADALLSVGLVAAVLLFLGRMGAQSAEPVGHRLPPGFERSALMSVLNHARVFVSVKDRTGRHRMVSQYLLDEWGVPAEAFLGRTDAEVAKDKEFGRRRHEEDLAFMARGQMMQIEEHFPRMPQRKFLSSRFPIKNQADEVIGLIAISQEITDVVRAHTLIERQSVTLAQSHKEFERFAYAAAHDLQEPLRTVASFSEILGEELPELRGDAKEYLQVIHDNASRGHQIVRDLLRYTQLKAEFPVASVDLNAVMQEITDSMLVRHPDATVTFGELPVVEGDREMLKQVFTQVIENGVKFNTNSRPHVDIAATAGESAWEILVKDNGIGIDPNLHKRVFELFSQLNDREDFAGNGIGLAISRRAIELHDGHIEVVQSNSEGTTVVCELPNKVANTTFSGLATGQ